VVVFEDMRVGMGWAYVGKVKPIMAAKGDGDGDD
jgi:hypothetical protein